MVLFGGCDVIQYGGLLGIYTLFTIFSWLVKRTVAIDLCGKIERKAQKNKNR